MNAYAILTRDLAQAVATVLQGLEMEEAPMRVVEQGHGPAVIEEASRVPTDLLVLDMGAGPGLGPAVLRYRMARPGTRVVLLAPKRTPGDAEVAGVVQAGVYDVVTDLEELGSVLARPPAALAAVVLWLDPALTPQANRVEVRERVIIERRPIGPVTLAIAAAAAGTGCTHTALAISSFLARRGFSVALVEANVHPGLQILLDMEGSKTGRTEGSRHIAGMDAFPAIERAMGLKSYEQLLQSARPGYAYIVLDLGVPDEAVTREMNRAGLAILVASAAPWRWADLYPMRSGESRTWPSTWRLVLSAPSGEAAKRVMRETGWVALALPYMPEPLVSHPGAEEMLQRLLNNVLPQTSEKKRPWWFRRKAVVD